MDANRCLRRRDLEDWLQFVCSEGHILRQRPSLLFQEAANQPDATAPSRGAARRFEAGRENRPWLRWVNKLQQASRSLMTLTGHRAPVIAVQFSPDDSRIASMSVDGTLKLWDALTGAETASIGFAKRRLRTCAFSPDSLRLAVGCGDGFVVFLDVRTGRVVSRLDAHAGGGGLIHRLRSTLKDMSFWLWRWAALLVALEVFRRMGTGQIPMPRWLFPAMSAWQIRLFNWLVGGMWVFSFLAAVGFVSNVLLRALRPSRAVTGCAYSADGTRLMTASLDSTIKVWNTADWTCAVCFRDRQPIESCGFSPDGQRVLASSGTPDKDLVAGEQLTLWNAVTGEGTPLGDGGRCAAAARGPVLGSALSRNVFRSYEDLQGRTGPSPQETVVRLHDALTGQTQHELKYKGGRVRSLALSADGTRIVCASRIGDFYADDEFEPHLAKVSEKPDQMGELRVWMTTGDQSLSLGSPADGEHLGDLTACAFSSTGERVISGAADGTLKIWDATGLALEPRPELPDSPIRSCCFSQTGARIMSGSQDGSVLDWDGQSGTLRAKIGGVEKAAVTSCTLSPDGSCLLTECLSIARGHFVALLNSTTGGQVTSTAATVSAFSPDGALFYTSSLPKLEFRSGSRGGLLGEATNQRYKYNWIMRHLTKDAEAHLLVCSPDGTRLAAAYSRVFGRSDYLRLWDLQGRKLVANLLDHGGPVATCAFTPDGASLVSGCGNGTLMIWEAATGRRRATLKGHAGTVNDCSISPDGRLLASASSDSTVKIWDLTTGEPLSTLGHDRPVRACAYSPNGRYLASTDGSVRVWDVGRRDPICRFGIDWRCASVAWSPDGRGLLTRDQLGTMVLLRLEAIHGSSD